MEYVLSIAETPELAEVWWRSTQEGWTEGTASPGEFTMFAALLTAILREWENSYYQYQHGLFTEEEFDGRRGLWRRYMTGSPGYRDVWTSERESYAPSFRAAIWSNDVAQAGSYEDSSMFTRSTRPQERLLARLTPDAYGSGDQR